MLVYRLSSLRSTRTIWTTQNMYLSHEKWNIHVIWNQSSLRSEEKIKPLKQKTKDRLTVIGLLALESFFIFGSISNFYRYIFLKIYLDIFLAIFSTIGAVLLFVFIIVILISYLDKRKVLKSFQKWARKSWNLSVPLQR